MNTRLRARLLALATPAALLVPGSAIHAAPTDPVAALSTPGGTG